MTHPAALAEDFPPEVGSYLDNELTRARFIKKGREYIADARGWLAANNARLQARLTLLRYAKAHDALITATLDFVTHHWCAENKTDNAPVLAILALGGYGRRELYLHSDIDVMILMDGDVPEEFVKSLMHLLIDLRLNLGYSTRTLEDCMARIGVDLDSTTAMTEARLIAGSRALANRLTESVKEAVTGKWRKWFIRAIYEQWQLRRDKYQSTVFLLEPNLKECPGGLRDVHMLQWLLYALTGSAELRQLREVARIDEDELRRYREAIAMIQVVRNELHVAFGGKNDHLLFAHQPAIARALGYDPDSHRSSEEVFMGDYYRHAKVIARDTQRALRVISADNKGLLTGLVSTLRRRRVDRHLMVQDDVLFIDPKYPNYLEEHEEAILPLFESAARWGLRISDQTLDHLSRVARSLGPAFRLDPRNHASFLNLLKAPHNVAQALFDMHACSVLDKLLPEFERINCMVRIDHYHHYTVDEHTLKAVENAEKLRHEGPRARSFAARVASQIKRYDLLYLALILHDIGKGFGRGHALRGGQIAQRVGDRLGLPPEDIELVRFLVLSHLKLSHTAQRRDVGDPNVARQLAEEIGSLPRLKLLYVHSVCDLMAVSPDAWNDWKGQLLQQAYAHTAEILGEQNARSVGNNNHRDALSRPILAAILEQEALEGLARRRNLEQLSGEIADFLRHASDRYVQTASPEAMARHFKMRRGLNEKQVIDWHLETDDGMGRSEIWVCANDVPGLFNYICGAFAAKGINICSAQIFSTTDGYAINQFTVTDLEGKTLPADLRLDRLLKDLNDVIRGEKPIEELMERHKGRHRNRHRARSPHPSSVLFDNESSQECTIIEIRADDRPGLLYTITHTLSACQLDIKRAIIATEAYGVADVFYVTDLEYNKIYDAAARKKIERALLDALNA